MEAVIVRLNFYSNLMQQRENIDLLIYSVVKYDNIGINFSPTNFVFSCMILYFIRSL